MSRLPSLAFMRFHEWPPFAEMKTPLYDIPAKIV